MPFGLEWSKPERKWQARARVTGECGDKVEDLAKAIGLTASEFALWLQYTDGKGLPDSEGTPLNENREFSVPNTGIVSLGDLRWAEWYQSFYMWNAALTERAGWWAEGLRVVYHRPSSGADVMTDLQSADLYRFSFFGHGDTGGSLYANGPIVANSSYLFAGTYTQYGVNFMRLVACCTYAQANTWSSNVSRNGNLVTIEGLLNFLEIWQWKVHSQNGTR